MALETLVLDTVKTFDKQSLIRIYEQHSSELFRYAYRMLGDSHLAEDCVSETFSRFLRVARENRQSIREVRPYLYRIAHNWITDHFRTCYWKPIGMPTRKPIPPAWWARSWNASFCALRSCVFPRSKDRLSSYASWKIGLTRLSRKALARAPKQRELYNDEH
jgi:RNA polymerase sigma factor (sigma-70 family)